MKRTSALVAAAFAAGMLAVSAVSAQSTSGSGANQRSPTDGRSGGTAPPSSTSGATPSTQPQQDMQRGGRGSSAAGSGSTTRDMNRDGTGAMKRDNATPPSSRSPTDGRAGGTSPSTQGASPAPGPGMK